MRALGLALLLTIPAALAANENGLPIGRTGGFGEQSCSTAGCHRAEPNNGGKVANARIEVGPYVPGEKQQVRVVIEAASASGFGFQLTARGGDDQTLPAGTFEAVNQFVAIRCEDGSFADAQDACGEGGHSYATHTAVGSQGGGQPGRYAFFFDWTPPADDVGPITFAASALAASGEGSVNDDISTTAMATSLYAPANSPSIDAGGVTGAAAPQREQRTISSLQLISIFGSNFNAPGTAVEVTPNDFDAQDRIPESLSRLSFRFNIPNDARNFWGRMIFVGENQANVQAPLFPEGTETATVRPVINRGQGNSQIVGEPVDVVVNRSAPGLFTFGGGSTPWVYGAGPAAAVDGATGRIVAPAAVGAPNSILAKPGDIVLLYGTGFGPTDPAAVAGELVGGAANLVNPVTIEIGGMGADILYQGAAPNYAGLTQFNVRIPDLPPGEHALVIRQQSGFATQPDVFIAIGE